MSRARWGPGRRQGCRDWKSKMAKGNQKLHLKGSRLGLLAFPSHRNWVCFYLLLPLSQRQRQQDSANNSQRQPQSRLRILVNSLRKRWLQKRGHREAKVARPGPPGEDSARRTPGGPAPGLARFTHDPAVPTAGSGQHVLGKTRAVRGSPNQHPEARFLCPELNGTFRAGQALVTKPRSTLLPGHFLLRLSASAPL